METQRKTTTNASQDTCEMTMDKIESRGSSSPHMHFTKHIAGLFEEPPRESNLDLENSSFLIPQHQNMTGMSYYYNPHTAE
jgi:hypothetical protein